MTRKETVEIIKLISANYYNFKPRDMSMVVDLWHEAFSNCDYAQVSKAVKAYIIDDTSGFAPTIGQLVGKVRDWTGNNYPTDMEAWAMVRKALDNAYYHTKREYEKLPEIVQKAVGDMRNLHSWSLCDIEDVETVIQSNFIKCYRAVVQRDRDTRNITPSVLTMIKGVSQDKIVVS